MEPKQDQHNLSATKLDISPIHHPTYGAGTHSAPPLRQRWSSSSSIISMKNPSEGDIETYPSTSSQLQLPILQYTEMTNVGGCSNLSPSNLSSIEHNRAIEDRSANAFNLNQKHEFLNANNNGSDLRCNRRDGSSNFEGIIPAIIKEENDEKQSFNTASRHSSSLSLQEINQKSMHFFVFNMSLH